MIFAMKLTDARRLNAVESQGNPHDDNGHPSQTLDEQIIIIWTPIIMIMAILYRSRLKRYLRSLKMKSINLSNGFAT